MVRRALLLGLLLTAAGCSFYMGEPKLPKINFQATLNGASEVPPTDTKGSGYFTAAYRPSTKVLEYRLNLVRLSGPVTIAYLQGPAGPGENAEKVVPIDVPFYRRSLAHFERSDTHRGTGGPGRGRPLVRERHDGKVPRRRNPRPDPAAEIAVSRSFSFQPIHSQSPRPITSSRSRPFSHGNSSVKKVTHWR